MDKEPRSTMTERCTLENTGMEFVAATDHIHIQTAINMLANSIMISLMDKEYIPMLMERYMSVFTVVVNSTGAGCSRIKMGICLR